MGCEFFKLGNTTGIICGGKSDHECDSNGPGMAILCSGEYIYEHEVTNEHEVCGVSVSCSICGKPFSLPM